MVAQANSGITSLGILGPFFKIAWSGALLRVLNNAFDRSLKTEEKAAMPLAGGIVQHGYQCGMIWGASLAAGAQAYRLLGAGPRAEAKAIIVAQRLVESFRILNRDINCLEITGIDKSSSAIQMINYFVIQGGTISCFRKAARYAQISFGEINTALSKNHFEVPPHLWVAQQY